MRYGNIEEFKKACGGRRYHPSEADFGLPTRGERAGGAERGLGVDGVWEAVGGAVEL